MNRTSLSRCATCRIRSSPRTTLARPCVRRAVDCSEFLLASSLSSVPSATGCPALFEDFLGVGSGEAAERDAPLPPPALPNCPCSFPAGSSHRESPFWR